jgi:hypothetical protein
MSLNKTLLREEVAGPQANAVSKNIKNRAVNKSLIVHLLLVEINAMAPFPRWLK